MKRKFLTICGVLLCFCGVSQNSAIDSIKNILKQPDLTDTTRLSNYLNLAQEFLTVNVDSHGLYHKKALKISLANNEYKLPKIYNGIGLHHIYSAREDSARYYFDRALKIMDKEDDTIFMAFVYANYAMSYQNSNDFEKMIGLNLKAINLLNDNALEVARLHYNQAIFLGQADMIPTSKKHFKMAYENSRKGGNKRIEAMSLKGMAHYAIQEKKLDSAKIYLGQGLKICEETQSPQICYEINSKLGELYGEWQQFEKASELLLKAKEYALLRNRRYDIMSINVFLGQLELKRKNYGKSASYFEEFDQMYHQNQIPSLGILAYRNWADTEAKRGFYKKSYMLLEKYSQIKDSIYTEENRMALANADAKYEGEKKDREIAEQNLKLQEQQNTLQKKQTQYSVMTGIAIILLISSLMGWFLYQQRQRHKNQEILTLKREHQVRTLESLIEGEEKERLRIAKELHDGVNGDLSAIKYKLTSILEKNTKAVNELVQMIDKSSQQVRAISHNLVPPALEKFTLLDALEDYCHTMNEIHKPQMEYQHIGEHMRLPKNIEVNIYRIIQELVQNSIKHAAATEITVQTSHRQKNLQIIVEDNGKGFDSKNVEGKGIGLGNIRSRVEYLQGSLDLVSNDKGTSYTIEIDTQNIT